MAVSSAAEARCGPGCPLMGCLAQRRQLFFRTMIIVLAGGLAWLAARRLTPEGAVFTGLLVGGEAHLGALAAATRAAKGVPAPLLISVVGWVAHAGHWPVLPIYQVAWLAAGWAWVLGVQLCCERVAWSYLPILALPALLLPVPELAPAAACAWVLVLARWPRFTLPGPSRGAACTMLGVAAVALAVSGSLTRPMVYLDQGTWQALVWMSQRAASGTIVMPPAEQRSLVAGLGGVRVSDDHAVATLMLTSGNVCGQRDVLFLHGDTCVIPLQSGRSAGP